MPIETQCGGCGRRLRVADEHASKMARCPACNFIYRVPGANEAATAAAEPAGASASAAASDPQAASLASTAAGYSEQWRMRTPEGQIYGPVGRRELDEWVAEGRVSAECELQIEGADWHSAALVYPQLQDSAHPVAVATASAHGGHNPFADQYQAARYSPYSSPRQYGGASYRRPDRGGAILALGIIGWVVMCPVLSVMAWVMGANDLREMCAGRMDTLGMGMTQAGMTMGIIHAVITAFVLVMLFLAALVG